MHPGSRMTPGAINGRSARATISAANCVEAAAFAMPCFPPLR
jgi:hypothetical protein